MGAKTFWMEIFKKVVNSNAPTAATQMMKKSEMVMKRLNAEQVLTASILFYQQDRTCLLK